jgi:hypothetical protein
MKPSNKLINFIIAEFELEISNKLKPFFTLLYEVKDGNKQRIRSTLQAIDNIIPGVALDHLVRSLEAGGGDVGHGEALMIRLVGAQHRGIRHQREVNPIRNECNSYTDRPVIQTSSAQGRTSPAGSESYTQ